MINRFLWNDGDIVILDNSFVPSHHDLVVGVYDPDEARDEHGRWTSGGATTTSEIKKESWNERLVVSDYVKSSAINSTLRNGEHNYRMDATKMGGKFKIMGQDEYIKTLDNLIEKSSLDNNTILYRGVGSNLSETLKNLSPGDVLKNPGYTSTSVNLGIVNKEFLSRGGSIMEISAVKGTNAYHVYTPDKFLDQEEFILARNAGLRFLGKGKIKNGHQIYHFMIK